MSEANPHVRALSRICSHHHDHACAECDDAMKANLADNAALRAEVASLSSKLERAEKALSSGTDMLDVMIEAWVQGKEISDEEGRHATAALMAMNATLAELRSK